jgi:regulator of sigma E protease
MPHLAGGALVVAISLLAFALLILIHELGHHLAARASGMRVERFSIGFGPALWTRRRGETEWAISALPLGGYVRIAGMNPGEEIAPGDAGAYCNQAAWRRFAVILAGPAMNYATALVLAVVLVLAGGPAEAAGLRAGDRVLSVDGKPVATWPELVGEVLAHPGRPMALSVRRGGETLSIAATPRDDGGRGRLGIAQAVRSVPRAGAADAVRTAVAATNQRAADVLTGLAQVVTGRQRAELRGPVGIAQEMARSARAGAGEFLGMVWFISIVLALFNLLPIPALDGGRLVFLVYEIVTRRRVNQRVENVVHLAGFVVLFGLILWVTVFGDLARILGR